MAADNGILAAQKTETARAKRRYLFADLWCGAGGTSTGATRAMRDLDRDFDLVAVNHWPVAIDTHTRNHSDGRHHCADLESARPISLVPEGKLDLLMASPACTFHSRARGGKPVNDQQRVDPWHVVRWCTELRVQRLLIENVPEFMDWGPCCTKTHRPIPSRKGEYFRAWVKALKAIGFRVEFRVLCCADYGDPTTRNRFFMIGRSDGKPLQWPEQTHAKAGTNDLFRSLPRWRSAAEVIDWSSAGKSIFVRKRPLKPNTVRRILAGAIRYKWSAVHVAALQALLDGTAPMLEVAADTAEPLLVRLRGTSAGQIAGCASACDVPLPTLTAGGGHVSLVMAIGSTGAARLTNQPIPTITAGGNGAAPHLIEPIIAAYYGNGGSACVHDPLPTVTTKARFGLAEPILMRAGHGDSDGRDPGCRFVALNDPLPGLTTTNEVSLAEAFILPITHAGERPVHEITEPLKTITGANRGELALVKCTDGYRIDILYRMLNWRELARAMSFDVPGYEYNFSGNNTEIIKQIGNAVPCRTAQALVRVLMRN